MNLLSISIILDRLSLLRHAWPGIALLALGMAGGQPVLAEPTPQNVNRELLSITNLGDSNRKIQWLSVDQRMGPADRLRVERSQRGIGGGQPAPARLRPRS